MIRIKIVYEAPGPRDGSPPSEIQRSIWTEEIGTPGLLKMFDDDDIRAGDFTGY
jgi:hypothetical protein